MLVEISEQEDAGADFQTIGEKRQSIAWDDFASPTGGFNRTDPLLDVSLHFSRPLESTIETWPQERQDLSRRLHKVQKEAVPFNYDTTPRIGSSIANLSELGSPSQSLGDEHGRVFVEEAFLDFWADIVVGCGWVDRRELTFRKANWVIVSLIVQLCLMKGRVHRETCNIREIVDGLRLTNYRARFLVRRAGTTRMCCRQRPATHLNHRSTKWPSRTRSIRKALRLSSHLGESLRTSLVRQLVAHADSRQIHSIRWC